MPKSLRARLALLVLLAMLPVAAAMLLQAEQHRRARVEAAAANLTHALRLISAEQAEIVASARTFLRTLAEMPEIRSGGKSECGRVLASMLGQFEQFTYVDAVDDEGAVTCVPPLTSARASGADHAWFRRAIESEGFSVGGYAVGRGGKRSSIHFAYPIRIDGKVTGAVGAALDLDWLNRRFAQLPLEPEQVLTLVDAQGVILARSRQADRYVGTSMIAPDLAPKLTTQREGVLCTTYRDGSSWLLAFMPFGPSSPSGRPELILQLGIDQARIAAAARADFIESLGLLALAGALAIGVIWIGGSRLVIRPAEHLAATADKMNAGDLSARMGPAYGQGEFSRLAKAFDAMAEALQRREAEYEGNAAALARQEKALRTALSDKEFFLREVHHRVKNNLQAIVAMLNMHARLVADPASRESFRKLRWRVHAMGLVYQLVIASPVGSRIRLSDFLMGLADSLASSYGPDDRKIEFRRDLRADTHISLDKAIPVGLVVTELLMTAYKHVFPSGQGEIRIATDLDDSGRVTLVIADNGIGPALPNADREGALGITLVKRLVEQIDGEMRIDKRLGTAWMIQFAVS